VARSCATARSLAGRHSGGVNSVHLTRPDLRVVARETDHVEESVVRLQDLPSRSEISTPTMFALTKPGISTLAPAARGTGGRDDRDRIGGRARSYAIQSVMFNLMKGVQLKIWENDLRYIATSTHLSCAAEFSLLPPRSARRGAR